MRLLIAVLLTIGWLLSGYLLFRHFELTQSPEEGVPAGVCASVAGADCDAALQSSLAIWWGLPLAGWGLAYYGTLAVLAGTSAVFAVVRGNGGSKNGAVAAAVVATLDRWGTALAVVGALVSLGLLGAMGSGLTPFCPLCCGVHVVNLVLAVVWFRCAKANDLFAKTASGMDGGSVELETPTADLGLVLTIKLLGIVAALLAGLTTGLWVALLTLWFPGRGEDPQAALASFALLPRWDIPVDSEDPRLGPEAAAVQIVVFSDFQCASCRRVARDLNRIRSESGEQVSLVFKHFPLGSDCNPAVLSNVHPLACDAARLAEAARRQNQFWDFHDLVFEGIGLVGISPDRVAQQTGVDKARLDVDMRSAEVAARIETCVDLGIRLGVDETPAVFIGGRRAPGTSLEILRTLVNAERANAIHKAVAQGALRQVPADEARDSGAQDAASASP